MDSAKHLVRRDPKKRTTTRLQIRTPVKAQKSFSFIIYWINNWALLQSLWHLLSPLFVIGMLHAVSIVFFLNTCLNTLALSLEWCTPSPNCIHGYCSSQAKNSRAPLSKEKLYKKGGGGGGGGLASAAAHAYQMNPPCECCWDSKNRAQVWFHHTPQRSDYKERPEKATVEQKLKARFKKHDCDLFEIALPPLWPLPSKKTKASLAIIEGNTRS